MRRFGWAALCAVGAVTLAGAARADTFTLTNTRHDNCQAEFGVLPSFDCNKLAGNGFATSIPGGYQLVGPDLQQDGPVDPNTVTLTAIAEASEVLTYNWDYFSEDTISAAYDPAGFVLGGAQTQLTADYLTRCEEPGPPCSTIWRHQTGQITFNLSAGQQYGFYVHSGDSAEGAGIISFALQPLETPAGAPEPSTWAMMILGFGLAGAGLRRRQVSAS